MTRREQLTRAVKLMFAVLGIGFVYILLSSLTGPSRTSSAKQVFDNVQIGQTGVRRYQGQRVWVTRLSEVQRTQLATLDEHVADSKAGCNPNVTLCALSAHTQRDGIEITFSEKRPPQLPEDIPWFGGLVDPTSNAIFDRLGRRYALDAATDDAGLVVIPTK